MADTIPAKIFTEELVALLTETFESVQGVYLDRGTSLLETLAGKVTVKVPMMALLLTPAIAELSQAPQ